MPRRERTFAASRRPVNASGRETSPSWLMSERFMMAISSRSSAVILPAAAMSRSNLWMLIWFCSRRGTVSSVPTASATTSLSTGVPSSRFMVEDIGDLQRLGSRAVRRRLRPGPVREGGREGCSPASLSVRTGCLVAVAAF